MAKTARLAASGLNISTNPLSRPEGALSEATNVIIRRDGVVEPRRGFQSYGTESDSNTDKLFEYRKRLIRHNIDKTLEYDNGSGTFTKFTGDYYNPDGSYKIKSTEVNGNFYFTTSDGIKKISTVDGDSISSSSVLDAGVPKALGGSAAPVYELGDQGSFLPADNKVAYRVVWGYKDDNSNLLLGAPSDRIIATNSQTTLQALDVLNLFKTLTELRSLNPDVPSNIYSLFPDMSLLPYLSSVLLQLPGPDTSTLAINSLNTNSTAKEIYDALNEVIYFLEWNMSIACYSPSLVAGYQLLNPLSIDSASVTSNSTIKVLRVNFDSTIGATASEYFTVGQQINLLNWFNNNASNAPISKSSSITAASDNLFDYNFPILSVTSDITNGTSTIDVDITDATTNAQTAGAITGIGGIITLGELTANYVDIPFTDSSAYLTDLSELQTYLTNTFTVLQNYSTNYRTLAAANNYNAPTTLVSGISAVSVSSIGVVTVTLGTDARNLFKAGDLVEVEGMLDSASAAISGQKVLTSVTATTLVFSSTNAAGNGTVTNSKIYKLVITSTDKFEQYIVDSTATPPVLLRETSSASVDLTIYIPEEITASNPKYFYQIYRGAIQPTSSADPLLSEVVPDDEMRLIFEGFPTTAELAARVIYHNDNVAVAQWNGANLYTNSISGQGILASNVPLPYAKDIARWKNRTWFANTKNAHKSILTFLGTGGIVDGDKITIASLNGSNTYSFATGVKEVSNLTITFKLMPADLVVTVDDISPVIVLGSIDSINQMPLAHTLVNGDKVTLSNSTTTPSIDGTWTITRIDDYSFSIPTSATVTGATDISYASPIVASSYVTIYSANDKRKHVFWFSLDGNGTAPSLGASTIYHQLNVSVNQSEEEVMNILTAAISETSDFEAVSSLTTTSSIVATNIDYGASTDIASGSSVITVSTATQGVGEDWTTNTVLLSPDVSAGTALQETVQSLIRIINQNAQAGDEQVYAYSLYSDTVGTIGTLGQFYLEAKTLSSNPFYITANVTALGNDFNAPLYVDIDSGIAGSVSSISIANPTVITSTSHGLITGTYILISGSDSTPSIDGLHQVTYVGTNTFSIPVNVTSAGTKAYWINETQAEISDNNLKKNRVYYSKELEPEAVPMLNWLDVGLDSKEILRIFPLRDSLFVFKEDGLYRISGETEPFSLALFDSSCICNAEESLAVANNIIYLSSTQGISAVTESGATTISRAIDVDILKYATSGYPNYATTTFGLGYDSDNSYYIWMPNTRTTRYPNICYRYSNLTGSWTTFDKINTAALTYSVDDKLYLADGTRNYLEKERKDFERTDYADKEWTVNITSVGSLSTNKVTLSDVSNVNIGDVIYQVITTPNQDDQIFETKITSVNRGTKVVGIEESQQFTVAPCTIYNAIDCTVLYAPEHMGEPLLTKHLRETTMMFEDLAFTGGTLSYCSDLMPTFIDVEFTADGPGLFGSNNFGHGFFGGGSNGAPIRTYIPRDAQRCRYVLIKFNHKYAREKFSILGTTLVASDSTSSRGYR